jgi:hypothetical protein
VAKLFCGASLSGWVGLKIADRATTFRRSTATLVSNTLSVRSIGASAGGLTVVGDLPLCRLWEA